MIEKHLNQNLNNSDGLTYLCTYLTPTKPCAPATPEELEYIEQLKNRRRLALNSDKPSNDRRPTPEERRQEYQEIASISGIPVIHEGVSSFVAFPEITDTSGLSSEVVKLLEERSDTNTTDIEVEMEKDKWISLRI